MQNSTSDVIISTHLDEMDGANNPNNLMIRDAKIQDFEAIATIYNQAIAYGGITMDDRHYTAADVQTIVNKMGDRELILVAELVTASEQPVIGWGIIKRYSDRIGYDVCCETSIYLNFLHKGKGYGQVLQTALMQQVREYGYHHIVAKILAENLDSIRFHQRFGFEIVGTQKEIGFLRGIWHDVVIMQCLLS